MIFLSSCPSLFSSAASTQLSPLLPRNKKAATHGEAVVNFMNTDYSAIS